MTIRQCANWENLSTYNITQPQKIEVKTISIYKKYGIYGIRNKINNKIYIGKTMVNFGDRWDCHKAQLRGNYHDNPHLQNSWNKYGEDNFEFIIIFDCKNNEKVEQVNLLEIEYIKHYRNLELSYNIHDGGDRGWLLGKHLSEETKRKIGEKNRINMMGRKASDKTKQKMSKSQKRRFASWTEEDRKLWGNKMSNINKGHKRSEQLREKMKDNKNGAKYTIEEVREIRRLHEVENKTFLEISKITGIPKHTVYLIATYRRWKNAV